MESFMVYRTKGTLNFGDFIKMLTFHNLPKITYLWANKSLKINGICPRI